MSTSNHIPDAEGLEVVVIGSFNPAIFHPEWFLGQKFIAEEEAKSSEEHLNVVGREVTDIQLCGMKLLCLHDRLSLNTSNISKAARMQDLLLQIFTTLSHIPITACGINPHAHYRVSDVNYWHKIGHTLAPKDLVWGELLEQPGMQSLLIKAQRKGEFPGETYLGIEPSLDSRFHPGIFVRANYHFPFPKETIHSGSAELLLKFLKTDWEQACAKARGVADKVFDKIKPDND
jgi:hypothetical protein